MSTVGPRDPLGHTYMPFFGSYKWSDEINANEQLNQTEGLFVYLQLDASTIHEIKTKWFMFLSALDYTS